MPKGKITNKRFRKPGSAIAYALIILAMVSILFTSIIVYISSHLKYSFNRGYREQSFQVAEAGIHYYRWYLAHATSGMNGGQLDAFWTNSSTLGVSGPFEMEYNDPESGKAVGRFRIELTAPGQGTTIAKIKSTGWTHEFPNSTRSVQARFRRPSWSEYIFLSNSFMNFGDQATVHGKVHSNTGIRFDGIAHNTVSSLVPSFNDPTHGGSSLDFGVHTHKNPADPSAPSYPWSGGTVPNRPDVFLGGREFPVPEVSFTGVTADLSAMKSAAQSGQGVYFDSTGNGRRIILKNDGTFDVCTVDTYHNVNLSITRYLRASGSGTCSSCSGLCLRNYPIPNNGVIFVEDNVWVEGSVNNKRISVVAANLSGAGSPADIYIGFTNLRVANYDCNNKIGLVAQRDITVVKDCPDVFVTDAALLAQTGKVGISQNMSSKNSFTFNGAIASYLQPYFQHGVSGFAVRFYNFDNNLLYCPPPYFPTGNEYAVDLWEEL